MFERSRIYDLLLVLIGAGTALFGTVITELWLVPAKKHRLHHEELIEYRLSRLYTPVVIAIGKGQFSMTADMVFYKVHEIMQDHGYLADDEVMNKYIEFYGLCRFASYDEMRIGSSLSKPLPNDAIIEIVKQRKLPLKWTADRLEKALKTEKEFIEVLLKHYEKSKEAFFHE